MFSIVNGRLDCNVAEVTAKHGLNANGAVQRYVDNAVIRFCDPIVPFESGALKSTAQSMSLIGSGEVIYRIVYARYQYYRTDLNHPNGRQAKWFEVMKGQHLAEIHDGAMRVAMGG